MRNNYFFIAIFIGLINFAYAPDIQARLKRCHQEYIQFLSKIPAQAPKGGRKKFCKRLLRTVVAEYLSLGLCLNPILKKSKSWQRRIDKIGNSVKDAWFTGKKWKMRKCRNWYTKIASKLKSPPGKSSSAMYKHMKSKGRLAVKVLGKCGCAPYMERMFD